MKVISLLEPWASLIKEKVKYIETRSWKTNYRGELYIHASKKRLTNKNYIDYSEQISLLSDTDFKYGYIIAKCKLVDCILMDESLINNVKKNYNEYISGDYSIGRYAWILEDIEIIDLPMLAKGQLGIWDYYDENVIMDIMDKINYGWIDGKFNKYSEVNKDFSDKYILQSPKEVISNKIGVCWDQVELERFLFTKTVLNFKTYFICHYDNDKCPTHTFLIYEKDNKFYWFEHFWTRYRGIHEYGSLKEALDDIINKFIKVELNCNFRKNNLVIYEYTKPNYGLSVQNFYKHCENGINVDIDSI